jgi:hypothetical protein
MATIQDFTIFSPDDDNVVLIGAVDGDGNVVEASFSTDPAHPRPYLKLIENVGDSTIDFQSGGSVIGQMSVDIVDQRRTSEDKDSGFLTFYLADDTGDTQLLGCRGVMRQMNLFGIMEVIFDGVIGATELDATTLVTYHIQLRDARERERKLRIFDYASSTCIFPRVGPADGWGFPTHYDNASNHLVYFADPVMPSVEGWPATWFDAVDGLDSDGNPQHAAARFDFEHSKKSYDLLAPLTAQYESVWSDYGAAIGTIDESSGAASFRHPYVAIEWTAPGYPGWHLVHDPNAAVDMAGGRDTANVFAVAVDPQGANRRVVVGIIPDIGAASVKPPLPVMGVSIRVRSNREPTQAVPLYIEENFGALLKDIYDGNHSLSIVSHVRYDAVAMEAMIAGTSIARARIEKPEEDGRQWVQDNIYRITGYAPAMRNGLVVPVKYEIPDASEPLLMLDDTNVITSTWLHGPDNVVNEVTIEYDRDLVPTNIQSGQADIVTQKVVIQRDRINSQSRNGAKPLSFKPVTLKAVLPLAVGMTQSISDDVGQVLGLKRAEEALRRFTFGAQTCEVDVLLTPETVAAKEGDWTVFSPSWLPDYITHRRGMNRLMQIVKVGRVAPHRRTFSLVDAGPHDQPIAPPNMAGATITVNADYSVTVVVAAVPADGKTEVQYGLGPVRPSPESGEWKLMGVPLAAPGSVQTQPNLPVGTTVWIRYRGTQDGRRASAWFALGNVVIPDVPMMRDFSVVILGVDAGADYGKPLVRWERLPSTLGIRILWRVFNKGDVVPGTLTSHTDVQPGSGQMVGETVLPVVLGQWQSIAVEVDPYSGFATGAVAGTAGPVSFVRTAQRHDGTFQPPVVRVSTTETATLGTVHLDIYDSLLSMQGVEFYTQSGNSAPGVWTPAVVTQTAPNEFTASASVALADGQTSFIGYRVTAYDADGNSVNVFEGVEPFSQGDYPVVVDVDVTVDPATGTSLLNWVGDSNLASIKFIVGTSGYFSAATVRASGTVLNGRSGAVAALGTITPGQTIYLSLLGYSGSGATGLESTQLYQYQETRPILDGTIPPGIQEVTSETAVGTVPMIGTLVINVTDPQLRVTGVRTRVQVGNTAWTAFTALFAPGTAFTVTMVEGHISKIEYEVWANMGTGSALYFRGAVPFGTGSIPLAPTLIPAFDGAGNLNVAVVGDSDTASIRLGASLTSQAAANANAAAATAVSGRIVQYTNVLTSVASGATAFLAAIAYPLTGGAGTASQITPGSIAREGAGTMTPTGTIVKTIRVHGTSFNAPTSSDALAAFSYSNAGIAYTGSTTALNVQTAVAWTVFPPGVTITAIRVNWAPGSNTSSGDGRKVGVSLLDALPNGGGTSAIATFPTTQGSVSGPWRTDSVTVSVTAPTDSVIIQLSMGPTATVGYVEIEYAMPSYDKTI